MSRDLLAPLNFDAAAGDEKHIDWQTIEASLNARGYAVISKLFTNKQCQEIALAYADSQLYRSRVVMERHGYGKGEYQYFSYPLPAYIAQLRTRLYERLAPIANRWNAAMGINIRYPEHHAAFLEQCHAAGQKRPTPLILKYGTDDYNCLHQDLYGEHVFPLQMAALLSEPGVDFTGGEFILTEQRPRMQSRVEVVPLKQGDAVVFATHHRPVIGDKRTYRVNMRHGVSPIRAGERYTLGVILHDAE